MAELSDKGISYSGAFFILIALAFGGMMLGGILAIPIITLMSGKGLITVSAILNNSGYLREMQVVQSISAIFGFLLPTVFTANLISRRPLELTGWRGRITTQQLLLTVFIIGCGLALSSSLGYMSYQIPLPKEVRFFFETLESDYTKMAANLINLDNPFELVISLVVLAIIPAVCEEALFRGGLQNYMYRSTRKLWLSVIVVSLIFSAVHFSFYGFLSRLLLGIVLGLLYQYSGRLWLAILAHFINNAVAVITMYVMKQSGKPLAEIMADKDGSYVGFLAIPVIIFLFLKFRQASLTNQNSDGI